MARTLDELAALSGVSRATVSRVINGGPVAEDTRRRVTEVLERTKFRPNAAARTLASGRSGVAGVVMHLSPHLLFEDAYFSSLLQGVTDALAQQAVGMMLWLGNRSKEETLDQILWMGLLDGVIVTAHQLDDPLVDGLLASELPTVLVGHRRADRNASYVDVDNVEAADMMTTHLVRLGRRRVGHITGRRGTVAAEDRIAGYERAMARSGLPTEGLIVEGAFDRASGAGAGELIEHGADAIFCAQRRERRGRARPPQATRSVGAGGRRARGIRRPRVRGGARSAAHDRPPGRAATGRRGRARAVPPASRPELRAPAGDPADGARDPTIDRGRRCSVIERPVGVARPYQHGEHGEAVPGDAREGKEGR